ncbi:T-cell activation inhibitor, mitochondrial-like [Haliotis cracherodii]|uniref:T-cell activation inhibitor, mitochondrial-like n=1 Tax=Haliotis cracherodii TaxID=6455 RepID=UPI0039E9584B
MLKVSLTGARWIAHNKLIQHVQVTVRHLNVQETAAALRPFYFVVHPDLFGKYPRERSVNEESLKRLHEYITCLQRSGSAHPTVLQFFFRPQQLPTEKPALQSVNISLASRDVRDTVKTVLSSFHLPLDYLSSVPHKPSPASGQPDRPIDWHPSYYAATGKQDPRARPSSTVDISLRSWLLKNIEKSHSFLESVQSTKEDIDRLCSALQVSIGLSDIRWESVWGFSHFRGCVKSFYRLYTEHPERVGGILKGRSLVFSNSTGVSVHGDIVLSSEDVPTYWMTLLMSVRSYEAVLERLPLMEEKLSQLLNNIQIVRRKRKHHLVMAEEYELLLNKLLNSLRRCQDAAKTKLFNNDLSHLQLVVEGESGPLALCPTGQFLVPASIPGSILIDYIAKHKQEADKIIRDMESCLRQEQEVVTFCQAELELSALSKDESVTPQQMVDCCQKLVDEAWLLGVSLKGLCLRVSHFYSVMQDGEICIPWDWKSSSLD